MSSHTPRLDRIRAAYDRLDRAVELYPELRSPEAQVRAYRALRGNLPCPDLDTTEPDRLDDEEGSAHV
jgi:hypothetical protein